MRPPRALPQAKLGATNVTIFMKWTTKVINLNPAVEDRAIFLNHEWTQRGKPQPTTTTDDTDHTDKNTNGSSFSIRVNP
jgi:hypothetical protein